MIKTEEMLDMLRDVSDPAYKEFNDRILNAPGMPTLGVRVPKLREIAKKAAKDTAEETKEGWIWEMENGRTPDFQEEHMVYGMAIGYGKADTDRRRHLLDTWIPGIVSWADCDSGVSTHRFMTTDSEYWFSYVDAWSRSSREMEVRFAAVALMDFFLNDEYIDRVLEIYRRISLDAYYVKMGVAWALSVCYVKYPEKTLALLKEGALDPWTHNKAIQKCRESFRVSKEDKEMLKELKRKERKR